EWIASSPAATPPVAATGRRRYWVAAVAAMVVIAAGLGAVRWARRPTEAAPLPRTKVMLETPAGEEWSYPRLSPDGKNVAFGTRAGLRLQSLDSLTTQSIASGYDWPFAWSPDSRSLIYLDMPQEELRKIDFPGGTPQTLTGGIFAPRGASWGSGG